MYNKKEREEYNMHRDAVCEMLRITKNKYNSFRRDGERLHKHYENDCNGYSDAAGNWNEKAEIRAEKVEKQIEERVRKEATSLGLCVYFQTDPRGATIYMDNEPIESNAYTDALCIY